MHADIRQQITEKIISMLQAGCPPWRRPWGLDGDTGLPANFVSKRSYSGVNTLLLSALAMERGYGSRYWGTFAQWKALGGLVQRRPDDVPAGDWGCRVIYVKEVRKNTITENGEEEEKYKLIRSYVVFNLDQVDGTALDQFRPQARSCQQMEPDLEPAERAIRATNADFRYGGGRAYYSRSGDFIQLPERHTFVNAAEWYSTHFHELAHWAEKRVGWSGSYEMGELVAEMAACMACTELAIPQNENLENHAAYLQSWLKALADDHSLILKAAAAASRSCDYILDFSREQVPSVIIV